MERMSVNGVELAVEVQGTGEPVLLVHGASIADAYAPLLAEPALAGRYRLITYHRRGYAGSSRADGPVSIAEQAADARAVLHHAGVERAHLVGHSYGGVVALQLALDTPEAVHSLVLLEPGLVNLVPGGGPFFESLGPLFAAYQAGDNAGAIDGLERAIMGPDYR
ncbi:MAG: alpha/beta fold hydrolase, partial [Dehalococcoidia bacterium]